ncbi:MAG: aromatic amino acid transport family protein, partial [Candidatus Woesearchaeota archaeon]
IGAGILGLPYVISKSGFLVGLAHILLIGAVIMIVNLYLGEITLRTKKNHQLCGYAEKYLGSFGRKLMAIAMMGGIYGAMIAYMIGVGDALNSIFPSVSAFVFSLCFFAAVALIVYIGLKAVEESELFMSAVVVLLALIIIAVSVLSSRFSISNLATINYSNFFLPFGVVLFAFLGMTAVPEMREEIGKQTKKLKKAIIIGGIVPLVIYALFAFAVIGISGGSVGEVATLHLGQTLGRGIGIFANLFAVFAMSTAFLALGLALKEMYCYDYCISKTRAWIITCLVPLLAFLLGIRGFIAVLGIVGVFSGGIQGILIALMHRNAKKKGDRKPEYSLHDSKALSYAIIAIFAIGIACELFLSLR